MVLTWQQNKTIDKSYCAGVFDGEGTINLTVRGNKVSINIAAYNTDICVLKNFESCFGGKILSWFDGRAKNSNKPNIHMWRLPISRDKIFYFCNEMIALGKEQEKKEKMRLVVEYLPFLVRIGNKSRLLDDFTINKRKEFVELFRGESIKARYRNRTNSFIGDQ